MDEVRKQAYQGDQEVQGSDDGDLELLYVSHREACIKPQARAAVLALGPYFAVSD